MDDDKRKERTGLADQLNRMLAALKSFGMDRQTPENNIYAGAGPGPMSMGAGQAPSIYGNGGLPPEVVQQGMQTMRDQMTPPLNQQPGLPPPMQGQGGPNVQALMGGPHQGTPMQGMHRGTPMQGMGRDNEAMDRMMMAIAQPYREGPNMNIGDDTRSRAMAWLRSRQGG